MTLCAGGSRQNVDWMTLFQSLDHSGTQGAHETDGLQQRHHLSDTTSTVGDDNYQALCPARCDHEHVTHI